MHRGGPRPPTAPCVRQRCVWLGYVPPQCVLEGFLCCDPPSLGPSLGQEGCEGATALGPLVADPWAHLTFSLTRLGWPPLSETPWGRTLSAGAPAQEIVGRVIPPGEPCTRHCLGFPSPPSFFPGVWVGLA